MRGHVLSVNVSLTLYVGTRHRTLLYNGHSTLHTRHTPCAVTVHCVTLFLAYKLYPACDCCVLCAVHTLCAVTVYKLSPACDYCVRCREHLEAFANGSVLIRPSQEQECWGHVAKTLENGYEWYAHAYEY